jgi:hypothetical protein
MHHAVCITQATKYQEGMVYNSLRNFYVNCVGTKYQHSIIRKGHLWLREENLSFNNNYLSLRNWLGRKTFICNTVTWANVCVDILNIFYSHMRNSCISSLQHVCSIRKQHRRYSNQAVKRWRRNNIMTKRKYSTKHYAGKLKMERRETK